MRIAKLLAAVLLLAALVASCSGEQKLKIGLGGPADRQGCRFRRPAQERCRAGDRGHQRGGRHQRSEDRARVRRRRRRPEAGPLGREYLRRRRRELRRRPLQLGRLGARLRRLRRERHPHDHAGLDQSQDHRPRPLERVPHLRARRPAGQGRGRVHRHALQGQEGRDRARQDDLRQGSRRRDQEGHERARRARRCSTRASTRASATSRPSSPRSRRRAPISSTGAACTPKAAASCARCAPPASTPS